MVTEILWKSSFVVRQEPADFSGDRLAAEMLMQKDVNAVEIELIPRT